jgi:hypothetical protein
MSNSPWGKIDSRLTVTRGLSWVSTPSHGGFAVADGFARKNLSSAALLRGERKGGYYFYEEDCDAYIILLEVPVSRQGTETEESKIIAGLSRWHADYLIERGITPNQEGFKFFQENRLQDAMRAQKHPDLIVSASGDWKAGVPKGCVEVTTADGKRYHVLASEYDNRVGINLLSDHTDVLTVTA